MVGVGDVDVELGVGWRVERVEVVRDMYRWMRDVSAAGGYWSWSWVPASGPELELGSRPGLGLGEVGSEMSARK